MNEHLTERLPRLPRGAGPHIGSVDVWIQPQKLNPQIRRYFDDAKKHVDGGAWLQRPEIPTANELLDTADFGSGSGSSSDVVEIVPNKRKGLWESNGTISKSERVFS